MANIAEFFCRQAHLLSRIRPLLCRRAQDHACLMGIMTGGACYPVPAQERKFNVMICSVLFHETECLPARSDLKVTIKEAALHGRMASPADKCHVSPECYLYARCLLVGNGSVTEETDRPIVYLPNCSIRLFHDMRIELQVLI